MQIRSAPRSASARHDYDPAKRLGRLRAPRRCQPPFGAGDVLSWSLRRLAWSLRRFAWLRCTVRLLLSAGSALRSAPALRASATLRADPALKIRLPEHLRHAKRLQLHAKRLQLPAKRPQLQTTAAKSRSSVKAHFNSSLELASIALWSSLQ